jgi:hypothetical protein
MGYIRDMGFNPRNTEDSERREDTEQGLPEDESVPHEPDDDQDRVDKESADSFPASDPPPY